MRLVPSPVTVVTAAGPGGIRGMTVGSFTGVSLDPPLISFNVAHASRMHDVIVTAEHFAVHVLSEAQANLSTLFAAPDRTGEEQFGGLAYALDAEGVPVLSEAVVVFQCTPFALHPAGDHSLLVGQVRGITSGEPTKPLVYYDRSYWRLGRTIAGRVWPF